MSNPEPPASQQSRAAKARSAALSPERRAAIAQKGAIARWGNAGKLNLRVANYGADGRPLEILGIQIPCYVLDDETRVLVRSAMQSAIGMTGGASSSGTPRLLALMKSLLGKGINVRGLTARLEDPIRFIPPQGGAELLGFEATILTDICAVIIDAQNAGKLKKDQQKLARHAAALQHAFSKTGIIALVDEATGYQDHRARDALAKILEAFVQEELRPWVKTFPEQFYQQIFRLRGWEYSSGNQRPGILGQWTNEIIYARLGPGVLEELRRVTPVGATGKRKHRYHQHLTDDIGHPKLREHLAGVVMLMKYAKTWGEFIERLETEYPRKGDSLWLPFPVDYDAPPSRALSSSAPSNRVEFPIGSDG